MASINFVACLGALDINIIKGFPSIRLIEPLGAHCTLSLCLGRLYGCFLLYAYAFVLHTHVCVYKFLYAIHQITMIMYHKLFFKLCNTTLCFFS